MPVEWIHPAATPNHGYVSDNQDASCSTDQLDCAEYSLMSQLGNTNTNASEQDATEIQDTDVSKKAKEPTRIPQKLMTSHIKSPTSIRTKCDEMLSNSRSIGESETNPDQPRSVIFIARHNQMYRLEFTTSNTRMSPLYVRSRFCFNVDNEKKVQPPSHSYQVINRENISRTQNVLVSKQKFALNDESNAQFNAPVRVYTDGGQSSPKSRISEGLNTQPNGVIYCTYKGILMRVVCTTLPICRSRLPATEAVLKKMKELRMPSSESRKNKGQIVSRYGNDLVLLSFDMDDISLQQSERSVSTAVQTEDRMVYIRERSAINGRTFLLALPESTYYYRDPMQQIHRLHTSFMGTNIMPLWKYEMMRTRVESSRQGTELMEAEIDKAFGRTRGSRLFFEALGSLLTVEGGILCSDIDSGQDIYDRMMCEREKTALLSTLNSTDVDGIHTMSDGEDARKSPTDGEPGNTSI